MANHHGDDHHHHHHHHRNNPTVTHGLAKKRRILQPHGHHFRSPKKPPTLAIPSFADAVHRLDPSPEISPRTTLPCLPPPLLRPCHVCHRKPTTRVMLDAYADCELCGERACYICLRECNALDCDALSPSTGPLEDPSLRPPRTRRRICSSCAVEGLTEDTGEEIVWCLSCVRREEVRGGDMMF